MKLISWNVAGRVGHLAAQAQWIQAQQPDLLALQEITPSTLPRWKEQLPGMGLRHVLDSFSIAPASFTPAGPRRYGQVLASCHPLESLSPERFDVPWPERILGGLLHLQDTSVEVYTTHIPPGSSNGWIKVEMFRGLYSRLAEHAEVSRILCGDFNTPQEERPSGEVVTWGQRIRADGEAVVRGTVGGGPGAEWDRAERDVLLGLAQYDLKDVFRSLNSYSAVAHSCVVRGRNRRYDHVFGSGRLKPTTAEYLQEPRVGGLSDHSPLAVVFSVG